MLVIIILCCSRILRENLLIGTLPPFIQNRSVETIDLTNNYFECPLPEWCSASGTGDCVPCYNYNSITITSSISPSSTKTSSLSPSTTITSSRSHSSTITRSVSPSFTKTSSVSPSITKTSSVSPSITLSPSISVPRKFTPSATASSSTVSSGNDLTILQLLGILFGALITLCTCISVTILVLGRFYQFLHSRKQYKILGEQQLLVNSSEKNEKK